MYDDRETNEPPLPAELAAFERQLVALAPATPRVDRDRLMFDAGAATVEGARSRESGVGNTVDLRTPWFWPAATGAMTAATLVLSAMLHWPREGAERSAAKPQVVDDALAVTVVEPRDTLGDAWRGSDRIPSGYLGLRHVALTQGVGALDEKTSVSTGLNGGARPPATSRELLEELLLKDARSRS
jgi:hypothetical protein